MPEGEEFCIELKISKYSESKTIYAQAPRYPKPKMEGWFVLLGDPESNELLGLKRINQERVKTESATLKPSAKLSCRAQNDSRIEPSAAGYKRN